MESDRQLLANIIEVRHLDNPDEVNLMLKAGWIILTTNPVGKQRKIFYSLGWDKNKGEVIDAIEVSRKQKQEERERQLRETPQIEYSNLWESHL